MARRPIVLPTDVLKHFDPFARLHAPANFHYRRHRATPPSVTPLDHYLGLCRTAPSPVADPFFFLC